MLSKNRLPALLVEGQPSALQACVIKPVEALAYSGLPCNAAVPVGVVPATVPAGDVVEVVAVVRVALVVRSTVLVGAADVVGPASVPERAPR